MTRRAVSGRPSPAVAVAPAAAAAAATRAAARTSRETGMAAARVAAT